MLLGIQLANGDAVIVSGVEALTDLTLIHDYQASGCRGTLRIPGAPEPNHAVSYCIDSGPWRTLNANLPTDRSSPGEDHDRGGSPGGS